MRACRGCGHFVRIADSACPFCGVAHTCLPGLAWALVSALGAIACSPAVGTPDEETGDATGTATTSASTVDPTTLTTASSSTMTTTTGTTDPSTTGSDEVTTAIEESSSSSPWSAGEAAYGILDPDIGDDVVECDLWAQDCPIGEKCMPWANDGGNAWNATRCSPLDPRPGAIGDPCTVEGSGVSGIDDCGLAVMCWDVDPETNEGTCIGLCEGTPAAPMCDAVGTICVITNEGVLPLCHLACDPMMPVCPDGQQCFPVDDAFVCAPG